MNQLTAQGTRLSPTSTRVAQLPKAPTKVALASLGQNYLLAWREEDPLLTQFRIFAVRVSPTGAVLDTAPILLASTTALWSHGELELASGVDQSLVFWTSHHVWGGRIASLGRAVRLSHQGTVLDPSPLALSELWGKQVGRTSIAAVPSGFLLTAEAGLDGLFRQVDYDGGVPDGGPLENIWLPRNVAIAVQGDTILAVGTDCCGLVKQRAWAYHLDGGTIVDGVEAGGGDDSVRTRAVFDGRTFIATWRSYWVNAQGGLLARFDPTGPQIDTPPLFLPVPVHALASAGNGKSVMLTLLPSGTNPFAETRLAFMVHDNSPRTNGATCLRKVDCASSHCIDGVCCDNACAGGMDTDCIACSVARGAAIDGTCGSVVAANVVCRVRAGPCDVAELCDGLGPTCPADSRLDAGVPCAPARSCLAEALCDGTAQCPYPAPVPNGTPCYERQCVDAVCQNGWCSTAAVFDAGTPCADEYNCTVDDRCDAFGWCRGTFKTCGDEVCRAGYCSEAEAGCTLAVVPDGTDCDGGTCWSGFCVPRPVMPDAGTPVDGGRGFDGGVFDAGGPDAGSADGGEPDAGTPDAGEPDAGTMSSDAGPWTEDAGQWDAGTADSGAADASVMDAGLSDAGPMTTADGGTQPNTNYEGGGCGCQVGDSGWAIVLAACVFRRRRRLRAP